MGIMVWTHVQPHRLRQDGSLTDVLSTEESQSDEEELLEMAHRWKIVGVDLISSVSCDAPYGWLEKRDSEWECSNDRNNAESFHVAYDFEVKHNILRRLASYGCRITVVPSKWPALETLKMKPDGVLLSNGPGDRAAVPYAVETVKEIIGKVPVFGICIGHQLLGQALGGRSFKMKFRHHGGNHPVHKLLLKHYDNILRGTRKPAKEKKTATSLPLPLDPILLASTEGLSEKKSTKKQRKKRL